MFLGLSVESDVDVGNMVGDPWFLMEISGNLSYLFTKHGATFIDDFRAGVANLTNTETEQVKINGMSYTPSLLVNLSLQVDDSNVTHLENLLASSTGHNLIELQETEFTVTSVISQDKILVPQEWIKIINWL